MKTVALLVGIAAFPLCAQPRAEALRCDGDLAQVGDSRSSVFLKCGGPHFTEAYCIAPDTSGLADSGSVASRRRQLKDHQAMPAPVSVYTSAAFALPCVQVDDWTYFPGPGQFVATLRFETGILTSIRFGARIR